MSNLIDVYLECRNCPGLRANIFVGIPLARTRVNILYWKYHTCPRCGKVAWELFVEPSGGGVQSTTIVVESQSRLPEPSC